MLSDWVKHLSGIVYVHVGIKGSDDLIQNEDCGSML